MELQLTRLPPLLLIFFHVEKSGGTTIRTVLQRYVTPPRGLPRRLHGYIEYADAPCFMCSAFGARVNNGSSRDSPLFGDNACRNAQHRCPGLMLCASADGPATPARWHDARIVLEFHASTTIFYHTHVMPRLGELRRLYAAHGGRVVTATLLREPIAHMRSAFLFWPPVNVYARSQTRGHGHARMRPPL